MGNLELTSHDGLDRVLIQVERPNDTDVRDFVRLRCSFFGSSYVRESSIAGQLLSSAVQKDYEICLFQLVARVSDLTAILTGVHAWRESKSLFELKLADVHEQQAVMSIGVPTDFICSKDEPVVSVSYSVHRLALEVRFKVCTNSLDQFAVALEAILVGLQEEKRGGEKVSEENGTREKRGEKRCQEPFS